MGVGRMENAERGLPDGWPWSAGAAAAAEMMEVDEALGVTALLGTGFLRGRGDTERIRSVDDDVCRFPLDTGRHCRSHERALLCLCSDDGTVVCIISGESNSFFCGAIEFILAVGGGGETRTGDIAGDAE